MFNNKIRSGYDSLFLSLSLLTLVNTIACTNKSNSNDDASFGSSTPPRTAPTATPSPTFRPRATPTITPSPTPTPRVTPTVTPSPTPTPRATPTVTPSPTPTPRVTPTATPRATSTTRAESLSISRSLKLLKNLEEAREQQEKDETRGLEFKYSEALHLGLAQSRFEGLHGSVEMQDVPPGLSFTVGIAESVGAPLRHEGLDLVGRYHLQHDATSVILFSEASNPLRYLGVRTFGLVAVMDGHGDYGFEASSAIKNHLMNAIINQLSNLKKLELKNEDRVAEAIENAFATKNEDIPGSEQQGPGRQVSLYSTMLQLNQGRGSETQDEYLDHFNQSGTTVLVAVFLDDSVYFANLGDSRAVQISKDGRIVRMTKDMNAEPEKTEVEKRGGRVIRAEGAWRINGILAPAGAMGDFGMGPGIIRRPNITKLDLSTSPTKAIALFCDGVTERIHRDSEIRNILWSEMNERGYTGPGQAAKKLGIEALLHGSTDNISAVVIEFK